MAKISTRELFDRFYEDSNYSPSRIANVKKNLDVPILYEYEMKIGKQMVDMDKDEFIQLVRVLLTKSLDPNVRVPILYTTYKNLRTFMISVCEWYSNNIEPIKIWLRTPELKGSEGLATILKLSADTLTWDALQNVFNDIEKEHGKDRADYIRLMAGLFHCGFYEIKEIIELKEKDVDLRRMSVILPGRVVKLDEATAKLLQANHAATSFYGAKHEFFMLSWRDSYVHFVVSPNYADDYNSRSESEVAILINKMMVVYVRNGYGINITFKNIYWLGFYDYIVSQCGEEHAKEIITTDRQYIEELTQYAREFGVSPKMTASYTKTHLRMYVPD